MMEPIISIETAKKVRELNIKLPMQYYYQLDFMQFKETGIPIKSESISNGNLKNQPHLARACTKVALQRWLREIHSIEISVDCIHSDEEKTRFYTEDVYRNFAERMECMINGLDNARTHYKSYEEALEAGLLKGVLLIILP